MRVSSAVFERIRRDCENPPAPSVGLRLLIRMSMARRRGDALYADPNPALLQELVERGRAEG